MKTRYVLAVGTLFLGGQLISLPATKKIKITPIEQKERQEIHSEPEMQTDSAKDTEITDIYYQYRKKKFHKVEQNIATLQQQQLVSSSSGSQSEVGKIAAELAGSLLFGANKQ
ncbi:hypothetical protein BAU15_08775 [Enterococcus sp. JM4C]|uniref:hypothetical protein n=1 Tax=Candidatus Enterococcus huntleyi TaxID=1857217 RepID=UPI00137943DC|nr:hypothetical protein [Enterococcus sp. JM4C]KAF1296730.1 hypothetical protein BAU15_08775 [Enterococcus sp. JM4C]